MTGLLIVDAQNRLFQNITEPEATIERMRHLLDAARSTQTPVWFTQDVDAGPAGSQARAIHASLQPAPEEPVLEKGAADAFYGTSLEVNLKEHGVHTVVLCGLQTPACVFATAVGAVYRGFNVILAEDAHGTNDAGGFTAQNIVSVLNAVLDGFVSTGHGFDVTHPNIQVKPADQISFG